MDHELGEYALDLRHGQWPGHLPQVRDICQVAICDGFQSLCKPVSERFTPIMWQPQGSTCVAYIGCLRYALKLLKMPIDHRTMLNEASPSSPNAGEATIPLSNPLLTSVILLALSWDLEEMLKRAVPNVTMPCSGTSGVPLRAADPAQEPI